MRSSGRGSGVLRTVQSPLADGQVAVESWPEYLRRIAPGQTQAQIAERIGIGRLSVCNWLHGKTRPKAETAIAVARSYRRSPIEALLAAGYLDPDELGVTVEAHASLREIPLDQLANEVARRVSKSEPPA